MDISDLVKQANNHEQQLKRQNSTQKKRETSPQRQNQATGKNYLHTSTQCRELMKAVGKFW
jgi:hypothetical protein